jgi:hypothetical protein
MAEDFEKDEPRKFGEDGFESFVEKVANLEKELRPISCWALYPPDNLVQLHLESKQLNVCSCGGKRGAPAHAEANRGNCPAAEGLRSQPLHRNSGIIRVRFPGLGLGYCGL